MGCPGFTEPQYVPDPIVTGSYFYPKAEAWAGHPRYVLVYEIFNAKYCNVCYTIGVYGIIFSTGEEKRFIKIYQVRIFNV